MRTIIISSLILIVVSSCATGTGMTSRRSARAEEKRIEVEKIIKSGNFLIRMDRLDTPGFRSFYLTPSANFMLLDNGVFQMKLGYAGRQFSTRGIAAINLRSKPSEYNITRDDTRGLYDIGLRVSQAGEVFDIVLTVSDRGHCTASVYNPRIQSTRYTGRLFIP